MSSKPKIFISYKRNVSPDHEIATKLYECLKEDTDVFIDQTMGLGVRWAEQIEKAIHSTNYFIALLSQHSVHSEMVVAEIATAHSLSKQTGMPHILPVRLAFREPFVYPLSAYLDPINWALWETDTDTDKLVKEILGIIKQDTLGKFSSSPAVEIQMPLLDSNAIPTPLPTAQPPRIHLEQPEGTMDPHSKYYIRRASDDIALDEISHKGVTLTIKAPRQMGKSSLLMQIMERAIKVGKTVAFLDFQLFDRDALENVDKFYYQFASWLTDELELEDEVDAYWKPHLGNSQRCTRYMARYILQKIEQPLVLAMDEVDTVFDTEFRSDFFSMLRNWHNNRATKAIWRKLDLAFVTSTEPYQFIDNLNMSPFNVGLNLDLQDFDKQQTYDLNQRHGYPIHDDEKRLFDLLRGHPYLTRRALYLIASSQISLDELLVKASEPRGPFGDHLRHHLFRLRRKETLIAGMRLILENQICDDQEVFFRLQSAGLVRREGNNVHARCPLYEKYFKENIYE